MRKVELQLAIISIKTAKCHDSFHNHRKAEEEKATTSYNQIRTCASKSILLCQGKDGVWGGNDDALSSEVAFF